MESLTLVLLSILAFCLAFYLMATYFRPYARLKAIPDCGRVLLVVSHPDDESMFFGPTLVNLCKTEKLRENVFLLCMSNGDYRPGQGGSSSGPGPSGPGARAIGVTRKKELYAACRVLGLPEENITVLSYTKLRDDPSVRWREEVVSEAVLQAVHAHEVDTVITFDRHGVSGHKNHASLYNAMAYLYIEGKLPQDTRVYTLRSVNLVRKYSSILDLPMSFLLAPNAYTASLRDWLTLHRAMASHKSQYVWFRKLYMAFSRYNFINTFDQMKIFPGSISGSVPGSPGSGPGSPTTPTFKGDTLSTNKKKFM